ncbi:MAG: transcriptional repressor [Eubacteriales bacterium]|nr:transcriptional repressor [Eubacteriales bacterium]
MRGAYQTKQQDAVAALFNRRGEECLTAEEAYQALSARGLEIGKTTVYRAIARLCEEGALRRYAPQDSGDAARYQLNPCRESHLHIRCVQCGALAHLHCEEAEAFKKHLTLHHGFELDEGQTVLSGLCEQCASKKRK